jgi:ribosomal protein L11 methyltransferase
VAWHAITLELEAVQADAFADALIEAGADSVALDPAGASTRLTALCPVQGDPAALMRAAAGLLERATPDFRAARLEDQDWVRRSQADFAPIRVGRRLWVVPSWHEPPEPDALVLRVDPGLAFGTGSHPSTRLVLNYLEKKIRGNERVLDYGCGSGILAIAAAKLGAGEVAAVDVDPQAVSATIDNARANGVALRVQPADALAEGCFHLVLANILAGTLIALEPLLAARTCPGGRIALSGILETQSDEVAAAYATDFVVATVATEEGWALVEGRRK